MLGLLNWSLAPRISSSIHNTIKKEAMLHYHCSYLIKICKFCVKVFKF